MNDHLWAGVRERVLRLAERPGADTVFGARSHGFRLAPVMAEEQLRSLEAALGGDLPEPYRSFLLRVGGGGAGPDYGLMTPLLGEHGWEWAGNGLVFPSQRTSAGFAGQPFEAEAVQDALDALGAEEPRDAEAFATVEEFDRASSDWNARYEELYDAQEAGAVYLGEQGCGYASLLVVTGPHGGAMWQDLRPAGAGIEPTGHDFAQWYVGWLERTEQQLGVADPALSRPPSAADRPAGSPVPRTARRGWRSVLPWRGRS